MNKYFILDAIYLIGSFILLLVVNFFWGWVAITFFWFMIVINWTSKDPEYNNSQSNDKVKLERDLE